MYPLCNFKLGIPFRLAKTSEPSINVKLDLQLTEACPCFHQGLNMETDGHAKETA